MKRDKQLLNLILLSAEGEDSAPDLPAYSKSEILHHTAYLIKHGFLDGRVMVGRDGLPAIASYKGLTKEGYDHLDAIRAESTTKSSTSNTSMAATIDIFISHSSIDDELAEALAKLLQLAFRLDHKSIRCTSAPGYKLGCGVQTDEQIKAEIHSSRLLVGLLTPASIASNYVLFELGARWGLEKSLYPLLAKGAGPNLLPGPLKGRNALTANRTDMIQFLEDVQKELDVAMASVSSFQKEIDRVVSASESMENRRDTSIPSQIPTKSPRLGRADVAILVRKCVVDCCANSTQNPITIDFEEIGKQCGISIADVSESFQDSLEHTNYELCGSIGKRFAAVTRSMVF